MSILIKGIIIGVIIGFCGTILLNIPLFKNDDVKHNEIMIEQHAEICQEVYETKAKVIENGKNLIFY